MGMSGGEGGILSQSSRSPWEVLTWLRSGLVLRVVVARVVMVESSLRGLITEAPKVRDSMEGNSSEGILTIGSSIDVALEMGGEADEAVERGGETEETLGNARTSLARSRSLSK